MKTTSSIPDTLAINMDDSSIYVARESIDTCSRAITRALAILKPEIEAIKQDATNYCGSVERVLNEFMQKPANRSTQLFGAVQLYDEQHARLGGLVEPLVIAGNDCCSAMLAAADNLLAYVREGAQVNLQAWFEPIQLRRQVESTVPFQRAFKFLEKYARLRFGADITRVATQYAIEECKNPAADVLTLFGHQRKAVEAAQAEYVELAKFLKRF